MGHGQRKKKKKALKHLTRSSKLYNKHLCIKILLETTLPYSLYPPLKITVFTKNKAFILTNKGPYYHSKAVFP